MGGAVVVVERLQTAEGVTGRWQSVGEERAAVEHSRTAAVEVEHGQTAEEEGEETQRRRREEGDEKEEVVKPQEQQEAEEAEERLYSLEEQVGETQHSEPLEAAVVVVAAVLLLLPLQGSPEAVVVGGRQAQGFDLAVLAVRTPSSRQ